MGKPRGRPRREATVGDSIAVKNEILGSPSASSAMIRRSGRLSKTRGLLKIEHDGRGKMQEPMIQDDIMPDPELKEEILPDPESNKESLPDSVLNNGSEPSPVPTKNGSVANPVPTNYDGQGKMQEPMTQDEIMPDPELNEEILSDPESNKESLPNSVLINGSVPNPVPTNNDGQGKMQEPMTQDDIMPDPELNEEILSDPVSNKGSLPNSVLNNGSVPNPVPTNKESLVNNEKTVEETDKAPPHEQEKNSPEMLDTIESKIDFLVESVKEFQREGLKRSSPDETTPAQQLSYKSLYFESQRKIQQLEEELRDLSRDYEVAQAKVEMLQQINVSYQNLNYASLVGNFGKATEAIASLAAQGKLNVPATEAEEATTAADPGQIAAAQPTPARRSAKKARSSS